MPFAGGSMEGVDKFTPPAPPSADGRVQTSGPDALVFTAFDATAIESCAGWCDGVVRYSKRGLLLYCCFTAALLLLYWYKSTPSSAGWCDGVVRCFRT